MRVLIRWIALFMLGLVIAWQAAMWHSRYTMQAEMQQHNRELDIELEKINLKYR